MNINYLDLFAPEDIHIEKLWFVISKAMYKGQEVTQLQHDEMRKAFYIGFTECFKIMADLSDRLSEDQAAAVLSRLSDEARAFHDKEIGNILGEKHAD